MDSLPPPAPSFYPASSPFAHSYQKLQSKVALAGSASLPSLPPPSPVTGGSASKRMRRRRERPRDADGGDGRGEHRGARVPTPSGMAAADLQRGRSRESAGSSASQWSSSRVAKAGPGRKQGPGQKQGMGAGRGMLGMGLGGPEMMDPSSRDSLSSLHYTNDMLVRATYTPPMTADATLAPSAVRHTVASLRRNADLIEAMNGMQQVNLCFQEVVADVGSYRVHLSRVLYKIMSQYGHLFEQLLGIMLRAQVHLDQNRDEETSKSTRVVDALERDVQELRTNCSRREDLLAIKQNQLEMGSRRAAVMEKELETLRGILVQDMADVVRDTEKRREDEVEARRRLEMELQRSLRDKESTESVGYIGDKFGFSMGTLGTLIDDVEQRRVEQVDILQNMGDLFKTQSVVEDKVEKGWQQKVESLEERAFVAETEAKRSAEMAVRAVAGQQQAQLEAERASAAAAQLAAEAQSLHELNLGRVKGEAARAAAKKATLAAQAAAQGEGDSNGVGGDAKGKGKAKGGVVASSSTGVGIDSASQTVVDEECLWDPEGGARHEMSASGAALKAIEKDAAELKRWASLCTKCRAYKNNGAKDKMSTALLRATWEAASLELKELARALQEAEEADKQAGRAVGGAGAEGGESKDGDAGSGGTVGASGPTEPLALLSSAPVEADRRTSAASSGSSRRSSTRRSSTRDRSNSGTGGTRRKSRARAGSSDMTGGGGGADGTFEGAWGLTQGLRFFMSNLPRTVEAKKQKPLEWLLLELTRVYDAKRRADGLDLLEGSPLQTLPIFITENFLMRFELRRIAELRLYELLTSVKEHWSDNADIYMFARFLGIVVVPDEPEEDAPDLEVLKVYLYARRRMLLSEKDYVAQLREARATAKAAEGGGGAGGSGSTPYMPPYMPPRMDDRPHVSRDKKGYCAYVPLDHAMEVVMDVLSFMAPRKLAGYLRSIEGMVSAVGHDGVVRKPATGTGSAMGIRNTVRQATQTIFDRRAMQKLSGISSDNATNAADAGKDGGGGGGEDDIQYVVDAGSALLVLIDVLLVRQRQVRESLLRKFVEGDDDGDGVLSYGEFHTIVTQKTMAPHFSERKTLKMFQHALTAGTSNSIAIERPSFVEVCREFGLGTLLDMEGLDDALLGT